MSELSVSIVVPVANGGTTFADCLAALSRLAPPPQELIVVDDGSTDGSAERASAAGAHVIRMARRAGPAAARNRGAAAAAGDAILFVDADVLVAARHRRARAGRHDRRLADRGDRFVRQPADGARARLAIQEPGPSLRASDVWPGRVHVLGRLRRHPSRGVPLRRRLRRALRRSEHRGHRAWLPPVPRGISHPSGAHVSR